MFIWSHFAYLDAGTGSLIIQSLVGVAAGVVVFGRRFFGTIKQKVKSLFSKADKKER